VDWQGIKWVVPVYGVLVILVPVYGFIVLRRSIKKKLTTKTRAFWYYTGLVISPLIIYTLFFFGLVGFEEISKQSIITEGMARSFIIVIGSGIVIWVVSLITFGIALIFISISASSPNQTNPADAKRLRG